MFAIVQNGVLNVVDQTIQRAFEMVGQYVKRDMTNRISGWQAQRFLKVVFGNVVIMRDKGNGHPGLDCANITRDRQPVSLLEALESLDRLCRAKDGQTQRRA